MINLEKPSDEQIDTILNFFSDGQLQEALNALNRLDKDYPNDSLLFNIRGACYAGLGKLELAIQSYTKAIELKPDYSDAFYNLGNLFREDNKIEKAIANFKNALAIEPNYFAAQFNLGVSLQELGELDDAIVEYQQLLSKNPSNIEARTNLGFIYQNLGQYEDAAEQYELVLNSNSNNEEVLNNLGTISRELGQSEEAISYYKKAIEINPKFSGAYYNLGFTFQDLGQVNEAILNYEESIAINNHAWSYHNLSYLKEFKINDPHISKIKSLLKQGNLSPLDQIHLNLALAKIYENLGAHDDFFHYLNSGNKLRKKELGYSSAKTKELHSTIKDIFNSPSNEVKNIKSLSLSGKTPIFIVGMPRSGTTLVEQILSSHNDVYGAGELETLTRLVKPIINNYKTGVINHISEKALIYMRQEYENMLFNIDSDLTYITDKLPLNFQYIGFIFSIFPQAKIIHMERDARATCWSNYKHFFTSKENGYSHNFNDLVDFYSLYKKLMFYWNDLYPNRIHNLCYEDLTSNQEIETRKLLKYCNLEWDKECLNFHENMRTIKTPSTLQVRKKMYTGSSDAWKKYWAYIQPMTDRLKSY